MKRTASILAFILGTVFLTSCAIPKQSYVSVTPYAKRFEKPVQEEITLIFEDGVQDKMIIPAEQLKSMEIEDFRRSLFDGLKVTFKTNFKDVHQSDLEQKQGPEFIIHRVVGNWVKAAVMHNQGQAQNYEVRIAFTYDATLRYNGETILTQEGRAFSEQSASTIFGVDELYSDALRMLCETLHRDFFTFEVQKKLLQQEATNF